MQFYLISYITSTIKLMYKYKLINRSIACEIRELVHSGQHEMAAVLSYETLMMFTFYIAGCNVLFHFRNKPRVNLVFPPWGKVTGCAVALSGVLKCQLVHLPKCRESLLPPLLVTENVMAPQCLNHGLFSKSRDWRRYLGLGGRIKCGFIIFTLHRILRW